MEKYLFNILVISFILLAAPLSLQAEIKLPGLIIRNLRTFTIWKDCLHLRLNITLTDKTTKLKLLKK